MQSVGTAKEREIAIIVGIVRPGQERSVIDENLDELELLADTAGAVVVERVVQDRHRLDPAFMLGRGKVEELAKMTKYLDADLIIFDDDLSPAQAKNIESLCGNKILDRSGLILDIFARNARTREARTQVELAQLNYLLPRLTRQWTHLSRQVGGIGVRGPGETQLEVDRRLVRRRIGVLERELEKIATQRANRRKNRSHVFKAALVGYTNVGKSTILNTLTNAQVLVEDRLFATLDSTIRGFELSDHRRILLIDTVGFIRKLPHHLIASFKSTLEEAVNADLLLHVIDITSHNLREQMDTVDSVLEELKINDKPILKVFNKIDALEDKSVLTELRASEQPCVFISAERGIFMNEFREKIRALVTAQVRQMTVTLPMHATKALSQLHDLADITSIEYQDSTVIIRLKASIDNADRISRLVVLNAEG
ncbi:GTPase HflX [candidate division KSB1 bacterium]|nr:GTPase HflX [candidate division KSB1 bacterium]RQW05292.1 MAG: GTPase HflX [candidate division KSB1 bacterium]